MSVNPKVRNYSFANPMSVYMSNNYTINEGLIRTFPLETAKKHFVQYIGINPDLFQIREFENGVKKGIIYADYDVDTIEEYKKAMSFYGYDMSFVDHIEDGNDHVVALFFEPRYQDGQDGSIGENEPYFMHVTPRKHLEKILSNGLCPRESERVGFEHMPLVHLLGGVGWINALEVASELHRMANNDEIDDEYAIIALNSSTVLSSVELYHDPSFPRGYITKGNIPPSAIDGYKVVDLMGGFGVLKNNKGKDSN